MNNKRDFIINEMEICKEYCSAIHRERQNNGFNSVKYPLITVKVNRYFLPQFREIIAEECNLVGYMSIPPVEFYEEVKSYDSYLEDSKKPVIEIKLDCTKSSWQQELFDERSQKSEEAKARKIYEHTNTTN